jgi:hypothetical protein
MSYACDKSVSLTYHHFIKGAASEMKYFYKLNLAAVAFYCAFFIPLAYLDAMVSTAPDHIMWNWWTAMNLSIFVATSLFTIGLLYYTNDWLKHFTSIILRSAVVPIMLVSFLSFDFLSCWFQFYFFHTSNPSTWGIWSWISWSTPFILPLQTVSAVTHNTPLTQPPIPVYSDIRLTAILGVISTVSILLCDKWRFKK